MTAKVFVHPSAWCGPTGTLKLLAWAAARGLELVSSRRANIMLVPRSAVSMPHTERRVGAVPGE